MKSKNILGSNITSKGGSPKSHGNIGKGSKSAAMNTRKMSKILTKSPMESGEILVNSNLDYLTGDSHNKFKNQISKNTLI
jgi:hypothetical protein